METKSTILIIEDDKDLCRAMCSYLNSNGYETISARDFFRRVVEDRKGE